MTPIGMNLKIIPTEGIQKGFFIVTAIRRYKKSPMKNLSRQVISLYLIFMWGFADFFSKKA
jgi:hypothetical protein